MTGGDNIELQRALEYLTRECDRCKRNATEAAEWNGREESRDYLVNQVLDNAHAIIDYAHALKATIALQSTR